MDLTVLVDNNTLIDQYFIGEPAVSYYLETEGKNILFDAGYSDAFLINAGKLGIDLLDLDMVVLSHGHLDHSWGLFHLVRFYSENLMLGRQMNKPALVAHPAVFNSRAFESVPEIGSVLKEDSLAKFFDIRFTREPYPLTDKLTFLGEIERLNDFEAQQGVGMIEQDGQLVPDRIMDDSAMVYSGDKGLVVITGCSHAGICNILEQAMKVGGERRISDIVGGFHLLNPSAAQMRGTLAYFKDLKPACVHACHCTDLQSKIQLANVVDLAEVGVGLKLKWN